MRTADFDFVLPSRLIAQTPSPERDGSRLLILNRSTGGIEHGQFRDLRIYLRAGDLVVLNNSRVIPARLQGTNARTEGHFEILLLKENALNDWWAMMRPAKRAREGTRIVLCGRENSHEENSIEATVVAGNQEGHRRLIFSGTKNIFSELDELGAMPLPPYIHRERQSESDRERYQTVFAQTPGSIAAPTAGLHFTKSLLDELRAKRIEVQFITLHVGLGTFAPVKSETAAEHKMHEERYEVSAEAARALNEAKRSGRRIVAVGTTTVRVLESVASENEGRLVPGKGQTRIFIFPPYEFKIVDALLTNFHLPRSTLLMLVSAFAAPGETRGRKLVLSAYAEAIREQYRFFSYGDSMLLS
jgi:S-adenosylmethionine:tRNA ribosyltransferase-isomerase